VTLLWQVGSSTSLELLEDSLEREVDEVAKLLGLRKVGLFLRINVPFLLYYFTSRYCLIVLFTVTFVCVCCIRWAGYSQTLSQREMEKWLTSEVW